jgi:hypothetical protein
VSPWIFGYTMQHGQLINSLCVGLIMFVAAIWSATSTPHTQHPVVTHS